MKIDRLFQGHLFGGMLLIAGSCIGAGMLALPILTGLAGFFPSLFMLLVAWAFMTFTGHLLVEINGWFHKPVNLLSMANKGLGNTGYFTAWITYTILFYSILVAYIIGGGSIFSGIIEALFHIDLAPSISTVLFTLVFGWIIYLGTAKVDSVNQYFMLGLIISYFGIIAIGITHIHPKYLMHVNPSSLYLSFPVLVLSFGFQNLVPSLTTYMKGDLKRVKDAILGGSLITLAIYFLWIFVILGVLPHEGDGGILDSYNQGKEATAALEYASSTSLTVSSRLFAFFAIVTSFLTVGLTLSHFLADGCKVMPTKKNMRWLVPLALLPAFLFGLVYPKIFFQALSFAGGICTMILFGILPISMVWIGRYVKKNNTSYHAPGGKGALIIAFVFALFVIICEIVRIMSH